MTRRRLHSESVRQEARRRYVLLCGLALVCFDRPVDAAPPDEHFEKKVSPLLLAKLAEQVR